METQMPGDLLWRSKGPVIHYGFALNPYQVLDIVPGGSPRTVSLAEFANGNSVYLQRPNPNDRPAILARAHQVATNGTPYNIATFNCEHVKNFILSGNPYSETVLTVVGLLAFLGIAGLVARGAR